MVKAIFTSVESGQPMESHQSIEALAGVGLQGDRYAIGKGHYSGIKVWDAHVTLIGHEAFEDLESRLGKTIDPKDVRRNILIQGCDLKALVGREFQIGPDVILRGRKVWPPCFHIVKSSGNPDIRRYLSDQCGIGADVVAGGFISVGDAINPV